MALHNALTSSNLHKTYPWSYANATARTAATGFASGDLGHLALQLDDYSLWVLTATTPTWKRVDYDSAHTHSNATTSVAGFMAAADKTKLDRIETEATADQSANEILTALLGVDGTGSGLDADKLDGNEASAFLTLTGGTITGAVTMSSTYPLMLQSNTPAISLYESDAGTDLKYWRMVTDSGALLLQTRTDANVFIANALQLTRSGALTLAAGITATTGAFSGQVSVTSTSGISLSSSSPAIYVSETDQGTDLKKWDLLFYDQKMYLQTRTDADAFVANAMEIDRSGNLEVAGTIWSRGGTVYASATPSSSETDSVILYAADIAAGHRALHVRNENDTVIKLYQQALIASPSADVASLKTAVDAIRTLLINSGQMAAS